MVRESFGLLARLLDSVASGDLTADGPAGKAMVQHLEGALIALQVVERDHSAAVSDLTERS